MAKLTVAEIAGADAETVTRMSRPEVDSFALQAAEMVRRFANQVAADSSNSSRPPSSDSPYQRDQGGKAVCGDEREAASGEAKPATAPQTAPVIPQGEKKPEKPSGKRPGMPGFWRRQPIVVQGEVAHRPGECGACHATLGADKPSRLVSAHNVIDLERGDMALQISAKKHGYFAVRCECGHETIAAPGTGASSRIESRKPATRKNTHGKRTLSDQSPDDLQKLDRAVSYEESWEQHVDHVIERHGTMSARRTRQVGIDPVEGAE